MAEPKTRPTGRSVTAFLNAVSDPQRRADCFELVRIMRAASGDEPQMWGSSIVGFSRYTYAYAGGKAREWPRIGFSPRKKDLTLYLMAGIAPYAELMARLGPHRAGKGCLYLKRLADVDVKVLERLIAASIRDTKKRRV